jgi:co-chaperonin GroES (HSP10)
MIQPRNDRVLIRRIDEQKGLITLTDAPKGLKGTVLAVGPGKCDEDGDFQPTVVKPGDTVLFNSKWNDFAKDYYDDLPLGADRTLHLVQEADVFGIFGAK